jgi:hypothetical protein
MRESAPAAEDLDPEAGLTVGALPTLSAVDDAWLRQFRNRHGRAPAILHIGNIANNAYNLAKLLNAVGIDSDVLCYDYYHIMGCPEWEEADFRGEFRNDFYPAWEQVDLRGFSRPPWFAQGPLETALQYLIARRSCSDEYAWAVQRILQHQAKCPGVIVRDDPPLRPLPPPPRLSLPERLWLCLPKQLRQPSRQQTGRGLTVTPTPFAERVAALQQAFRQHFPDRQGGLAAEDLAYAGMFYPLWVELLRHYDLVVGYSTDGVYPLIAGRPYFAFEHGTIRNIPFEETPGGRLCALTYRLARHTFITNADNRVAAEKLGLASFSFLPHPINETAVPAEAGPLREDLCRRLHADFLVFHPSRQHWTAERHPDWEKGNDILIEGFARFVHEVCPRAGAVFIDWGQTVAASRALLAERGVADRVLWLEPQPNPRMLAYIQATDVLADQFFLGAFGSTMPKALMLGRPALLHLDESRHRWCLPEMPPVLTARTPAQVFEALARLHRDPDLVEYFAARGPRWYHTYHSNEVIIASFLKALREALP